MCRFAPAGSPLARAMHPALEWTTLEYMTAGMLDLARFTFWRESDRQGRGEKPEPMPRPGEEPAEQVQVITVESMDIEAALEWMAERLKGVADVDSER